MPNRELRHALIVGEVALSIVLTASALAPTRSALALDSLARGVTVDGVMTAQVALNDPQYDNTERLVRVAASMLERLSTSPGIDAAALVNYPPLSLIRVGVPVIIEGQAPPPGQLWIARYWVIAPDYFQTAGIRLLVGRDFTSERRRFGTPRNKWIRRQGEARVELSDVRSTKYSMAWRRPREKLGPPVNAGSL